MVLQFYCKIEPFPVLFTRFQPFKIGAMDGCFKEVHGVGSQMVHLVCDRTDESDEFRAMIEGGGVCIAKVFTSAYRAENWLHDLFHRMFRGHRCDLGCMRIPGHEFLADEQELERLAGLPDLRRR